MSKKGTSVADVYKFPLSNELKLLAKEELRETEATVLNAIDVLRLWADQNPRIAKIRMDSNFFLRFLRAKKFSIPMVQECIERYLLLRESYDGLLFKNMDYNLPCVMDLIDLGYIFALPKRDKLGRRIVITRPGVLDPNKVPNYDIVRIHGLTYETLLEDEENQIRGFIHIVDATGFAFNYLTLFTPKEAVRIVKNAERTLPMRHKSITAVNVLPSLKFAVDFGLALVTEKMRGRIHFYTNINNAPDIDISLLPKEYGGTQPLSEILDLWKLELEAARPQILKNDEMAVRLEMYSEKQREGAVSALRETLSCASTKDTAMYGVQGSFRKLEVD